jgi:PleD family two-component response regulator
VIVYEPTDLKSDELIWRIRRTLSSPISISGTVTVCCTASVGHADTRIVGRDPSTLLATADRAMYEAKRTRNRELVV